MSTEAKHSNFYPTSPREALVAEYVGKSIRNVPTPAAVINVAAVRRNCSRMLEACRRLHLGWRAHVKTHKTVEITRLQVGNDTVLPVNIVISTLAEGEFLLEALKQYKSQGRQVNKRGRRGAEDKVLYGLPITANAVPRLAALASTLGDGALSILLDDPEQLPVAARLRHASGGGGGGGVVPRAFIKIDMGGRRAGVMVESERFRQVVDAALAAQRNGDIVLVGLYSHAGHSYGGDERAAAIKMMGAEIGAMLIGAERIRAQAAEQDMAGDVPPLVLSGGASPTALSVQNLLGEGSTEESEQGDGKESSLQAQVDALTALLARVKSGGHHIEIHAGVYPILDLQQLAAHSMAASRLSWGDMALTVLAEVHSTYPGRGEGGGTPEALVGAGGLALGREPCKAYNGMAMVSPWGRVGVSLPTGDVEDYEGWTVGRFSQEHGIVTWAKAVGGRHGWVEAATTTTRTRMTPSDILRVGQKVRLWPNHACITSSHFGWYFVVDEERAGYEDEIVDIWIKARGW